MHDHFIYHVADRHREVSEAQNPIFYPSVEGFATRLIGEARRFAVGGEVAAGVWSGAPCGVQGTARQE